MSISEETVKNFVFVMKCQGIIIIMLVYKILFHNLVQPKSCLCFSDFFFNLLKSRHTDLQWFNPQLPTKAKTRPGWAGTWEPSLHFPNEWKGPSNLNCHLLSPMLHGGRKLELGTELRHESRHSDRECVPRSSSSTVHR